MAAEHKIDQPVRWRLIGHPVFTGAVAVLALNDQVLKARYHGWWTGKLSDFAGVVIVGFLAVIVLRGHRASLALAALSFAALKTVPGVAELVAPLLGGTTRRDPTDLLALLGLVPLGRWLHRRLDGPVPRGRWRILITSLAVGAMTMTVGATSCAVPEGLTSLTVHDGVAWAQAGSTFDSPTETQMAENPRWMQSTDGGLTWTDSMPPTAIAEPTTQICIEGGVCYRVVPGEGVDRQQPDGNWVTDFRFTPDERKRLQVSSETDCRGRVGGFEAVVGGNLGEQPFVIVSMGPEGALVKVGDRPWMRTFVGDLVPRKFGPPTWWAGLNVIPFIVLIAAPLLTLTRRHDRRGGIGAITAAVGAGCLCLMVLLMAMGDKRPMGPPVAIASGVVFAASVIIAATRRQPRPPVTAVGYPSWNDEPLKSLSEYAPPNPEHRQG